MDEVSRELDPLPMNTATEDGVLKAGYFELLLENPLMTDDPNDCLTPSSAVMWFLEKKHAEIPDELKFENLKQHIHPDHEERLRGIYIFAKQKRRDLEIARDELKKYWENAPEFEDEKTDSVMAITGTELRKKFEPALRAIIGPIVEETGKEASQAPPTELERWKGHEKGLRNQIYKLDKEALVATRLYYEMLLERPSKDEMDETTYALRLPYNNEQRKKIVVENRYLRVIDAVHQAVSIAKALHHLQPSGRLRKTEPIPYAYHPINMTYEFILDVVMHMIENDGPTDIEFVVALTVCALHDLGEDTGFTLDFITEFFKSRADVYDSRLPIQSGFGVEREAIESKILDLSDQQGLAKVKQILHVVTKNKNSPMNKNEKRNASQQNIAGKEKTQKYLATNDEDNATWKVTPEEEPTSKTFKQFPEDCDEGKLTEFLIKLSGCTMGRNETLAKMGQIALLIKIKDRTHNVATQEGRPYEKQLATLADTTTRLIAWCMLDHDQEAYPLYNALPRLIETTLTAYQRLQDDPESTALITEKEKAYITELEKWAASVKDWEDSKEIEAFLSNYTTQKEQDTEDLTSSQETGTPLETRGKGGITRWLKNVFGIQKAHK